MKNKLFLLAFIASASVYGAEVQLDKSVINSSATYKGSITGNESKNIVLISKQDIEKKQYKNMVDIFKDSPVTMVTNTPAGPLVALRGSGEKTIMRVKVLLDGKSITSIDEAMGVIPFNAIPVSNIEKIEIIPGGGITRYGSGSSSGVINIITKAGVTKEYGSVNVGASSFDTLEVSANKGIKLSDKAFLNLAVEGKKGNGYRDEEKSKKANFIAGLNYEINDKNRVRIQGTQYLEDGDSTNEVNKKIAEQDRRAAGDLLSNVESDRKAFSVDYEFKPTKNLTLNASGQTSKFTRDITQEGSPKVTTIPTGDFTKFLMSDNQKADLVLLNLESDLSGKFEETIKEANLRGNYKYNRGNLEFGMEHIDHNLVREMDFKINPFEEKEQLHIAFYPKEQKAYSEELLNDYPPLKWEHADTPGLNFVQELAGDHLVQEQIKVASKEEKEKYNLLSTDLSALKKTLAEGNYFGLSKYDDEMLPTYSKEELKKMMETDAFSLAINYDRWKETVIQALGAMADTKVKDVSDIKEYNVAYERPASYYVKSIFSNYLNEHYYEIVKKEMAQGKSEDDAYEAADAWYDSEGAVLENAASTVDEAQFIPITVDENMTLGDLFDKTIEAKKKEQWKISPDAKVLTSSYVNSRVDVNKETNSFYLFNSFDLTDKLSVDAGLRYEGAKYKGTRHTDVVQEITPSKGYFLNAEPKPLVEIYKAEIDQLPEGETKDAIIEKINELDNPAARLDLTDDFIKSMVRYNTMSEAARIKEGNTEPSEWYLTDENKEKFAKIIEDIKAGKIQSVKIPMVHLEDKEEREEDNLGGEIGFNYKFNDTDMGYVKYERGFNTPLPTQLTNKTYDIHRRTKLYWASNLETETMNNFEIGFRGMLNDNISYSVAGFLSDTYDEITSLVKDGNSHMNRQWRFVNLEKTRRMGIELQSEQFFDKLHLKESFTYVDPKILSNDYLDQVKQEVEHRAEIMVRSNTNAAMSGLTTDFDRAKYEIQLKMEEDGASEADITKELAKIEKVKQAYVPMAQDWIVNEDEATKELIAYNLEHPKDTNDLYEKNTEFYEKFKEKAKETLKELTTNNDANILERDKETIISAVQSAVKWANGTRQQNRAELKIDSSKTLEKGDRIPLAPKVKATFAADYKFTDKLKLGANLTYVGSYINAEPGNGYEIIKTKVAGHVVTDLYGTYDYSEDLSFKFGVNNLFEDEYYLREDSKTVTPAPGRTYSLGFTYTF